jgi:hypothetical protein
MNFVRWKCFLLVFWRVSSFFYHFFKNDIFKLLRSFHIDLLILPKNYLIMQTASFSGFIEMVFYMIAFYYIFKFLAKLFLPIVVKKVVEKAGQNFQQQQQRTQQTTWKKTPNNDEIIIDTANSKNPRETKKVGDYVDYEELE